MKHDLVSKIAFVGSFIGLVACSPQTGGSGDKSAAASWFGPPLPVHELMLEIDEKAMAELIQSRDRIRVTVYYYGLPTEASAAKASDRNELKMGSWIMDVPLTTKSVRIQGEGMDPTLLPDTADGQVQYKASANGVTPANFYHDILECSIARGTLTKPQTKPKVITCTLPRP